MLRYKNITVERNANPVYAPTQTSMKKCVTTIMLRNEVSILNDFVPYTAAHPFKIANAMRNTATDLSKCDTGVTLNPYACDAVK